MTAAQVHSNEFTNNPEVKKEDLEELKCWLRTQEHLPSISGAVLWFIWTNNYLSYVEYDKSVQTVQYLTLQMYGKIQFIK